MHTFCECAVFFFFTLDTIDILRLVYSNFCANEIIFKIHKRLLSDLKYCFIGQNFKWMKYKIFIYSKSGKVNEFPQQIASLRLLWHQSKICRFELSHHQKAQKLLCSRRKLATLHALSGNWWDQIYYFSSVIARKLNLQKLLLNKMHFDWCHQIKSQASE